MILFLFLDQQLTVEKKREVRVMFPALSENPL